MIVSDDQNKFDQRSIKAHIIILLGISNDVQPHVQNSKYVAEAWKKLQQVFS